MTDTEKIVRIKEIIRKYLNSHWNEDNEGDILWEIIEFLEKVDKN